MKTHYIGDRISIRTLITFGFIKKTEYSKESELFSDDENKIGVVVSKVKKGNNPKIMDIIGARCIIWHRNDVGR